MAVFYAILLLISAMLFSAVGTGGARWLLQKLAVMDEPGERSNHAHAVPRGAGLVVMLVAVGFLMVARAPGCLLWAALLLTGLSFWDDVRKLSPRLRLGVQALAVLLALQGLGDHAVFQGALPLWMDRIVSGLLLLWFVNLYNFMDGIDEITAIQTFSLCGGFGFLALAADAVPNGLAVDASVIAGAVLGFWFWNRHPARIFLGDAGSIPLGLLMGFMLLRLASAGFWEAALILPAYYFCDATSTLGKRLLAGKNIWQAHSEHAYQRAVRGGMPHPEAVRHLLALNMVLAVLAVVSTQGGVAAGLSLVVAYALAWLLMARLVSGRTDGAYGGKTAFLAARG